MEVSNVNKLIPLLFSVLLFSIGLVVPPSAVAGPEIEILSFHAECLVKEERSIVVEERFRIKVDPAASFPYFKRHIAHTFVFHDKTSLSEGLGKDYVEYSVTLDGRPAKVSYTESDLNDETDYFYKLEPGIHELSFKYEKPLPPSRNFEFDEIELPGVAGPVSEKISCRIVLEEGLNPALFTLVPSIDSEKRSLTLDVERNSDGSLTMSHRGSISGGQVLRVALKSPYGTVSPTGSMAEAGRSIVLNFDSRVVVEKDGVLTVTERAKVQSGGETKKDTFSRALRPYIKTPLGFIRPWEYEILSVTRDGQPVPWRIDDRGWYLYLVAGDPGDLKELGIHDYEFTYAVKGVVKNSGGKDFFTWPVVGDGHATPFLFSQCTVVLPFSYAQEELAHKVDLPGDPTGSRFEHFSTVRYDAKEGALLVSRNNYLADHEDFDLSIFWPEGAVRHASLWQNLASFSKNNRRWTLALAAYAGLILWAVRIWYKVGRDLPKGTVMPISSPPKGYTPAMMSALFQMGITPSALTAIFADLELKGFVSIDTGLNSFSVTKTGKTEEVEKLSEESQEILECLDDENEFGKWSQEKVGFLMDLLGNVLCDKLPLETFVSNSWHSKKITIAAWVIFLLVFVTGPMKFTAKPGFGAVFLTIIIYTLITVGAQYVRQGFKVRGVLFGFVFSFLLFLFCFLSPLYFDVYNPLTAYSLNFLAIFLTAALSVAADFFFRAPTSEGRLLMDEIEGFKMHVESLSGSGSEESAWSELPKEVRQEFYPYAVAFDRGEGREKKITRILLDNSSNTLAFEVGRLGYLLRR